MISAAAKTVTTRGESGDETITTRMKAVIESPTT